MSFQDPHGVRHSATVHAFSVLEAAGLGLKKVRPLEMLGDDSGFGEITVEIRMRTHTVSLRKLSEWCMQTAAVRGRCRAKRIRDSLSNVAGS